MDLTCAIFFKSTGCKDIKYDIFDWMTRKIKIIKIIKIIKMRLQGRLWPKLPNYGHIWAASGHSRAPE